MTTDTSILEQIFSKADLLGHISYQRDQLDLKQRDVQSLICAQLKLKTIADKYLRIINGLVNQYDENDLYGIMNELQRLSDIRKRAAQMRQGGPL